MEDRLVWSSTEEVDRLLALSEDELRQELIYKMYDEEMINEMTYDQLKDFVSTDEEFLYDAYEYFNDEIVMMIDDFSEDGIVTLTDGDHSEELPAEDVLDSSFFRGCDKVALYDGPEGYYFTCGDDKKVYLLVAGEHFKESVEPLKEDKETVDKDALTVELEDLKADYDDFGAEGFYSVPFRNFKKEFPMFTKYCLFAYLKNMEILTDEELEDKDLLDEYWSTGELIITDDWAPLFKGAEHIINDVKPQWDRLWKTQYTKMKKGDYEED